MKDQLSRWFYRGLALAMGAAAYAQEQPPATPAAAPASEAPAAKAATPDAADSAAQAAPKSWFSLQGTDLRLGNLPPITFHGFASQGFLASTDYGYLGDTTDGSFRFSEFGLNATMTPFNRTRISAQAFLFDIDDVGNYRPVLDYAMVDYTFCDEFGVRGGRIRRPAGIYNTIQDIDLARTYVLLPQGVYDARWRDFSASVDGGSVYGNIHAGPAGSFSYEAFAGMVNLAQDGGIARQIENALGARGATLTSVEDSLVTGAQLWYNTPLAGLRAGAMLGYSSGLAYNYTMPGRPAFHSEFNTPIQQYSLEYTWKGLTLQAEYYGRNNIYRDYMGGTNFRNRRSHPDAWYAGASYRVNRWLEVGAYYTEAYEDSNDRDGSLLATPSDGYQKDTALSFRFDPMSWWVVKVEGHYLQGTGLIHNDSRNPARDGDGWYMLALKNTFSF